MQRSWLKYSWRMVAFLAVMCVIAPARAQQPEPTVAVAPIEAPGCTLEETAQVDIIFSGLEGDIRQIKQKVDSRIAHARRLSGQLNISQIELQSQNFSISKLNAEGCWDASCRQYQFNGSVSFILSPAAAAVDYMALLIDNGFNANTNVSSYRQCP